MTTTDVLRRSIAATRARQSGGEDPDHSAVASAAEEREPGGELDHADDDGDPAPGVEAREHVCVPLKMSIPTAAIP